MFSPSAPPMRPATTVPVGGAPFGSQPASERAQILSNVAAEPHSRVGLFFQCSNLRNMDFASKSDPQVQVFCREDEAGPWREIGRTEIIKNDLNPKFTTSVEVDYFFERQQMLWIKVWDIDDFRPEYVIDKQDFIGAVSIPLARIVATSDRSVLLRLENPQHKDHNGEIKIIAEELVNNSDLVMMTCAAANLDRKDFFGSSDPFFYICMTREDGTEVPCYKSSVIKKNLNPHWPTFPIPLTKLCGGQKTRALDIIVYDWNQFSPPELIGSCQLSVSFLETMPRDAEFDLINRHKRGKHQKAGKFIVTHFSIEHKPSFLDYIRGGFQFSLICGIDFTASNGNPTMPESLHYVGQLNSYQQSIIGVGEILQEYNPTKRFAVYGFGARIDQNNVASDCFPLNWNPSNPEVDGVQGILDVYAAALYRVQLFGPTNFAPLVRQTIQIINYQAADGAQRYYILFILTDGIITDMMNTKRAIVDASNLPLSIVICGLGHADFTNMNELDSDDSLLEVDGRHAARDIVQFVEFEKHKHDRNQLMRETLAEIPTQFMEYVDLRHVRPGMAGGATLNRGFSSAQFVDVLSTNQGGHFSTMPHHATGTASRR